MPRKDPTAAASYKREKRQKIKKWVDEYKLAKGCVDCGYRLHAAALEFDHILPVKHGRVAALTAHGMRIVLEEIERCEVRCANCHRIKTKERSDA